MMLRAREPAAANELTRHTTVACLRKCLKGPWTPVVTALPHMDAAWVASDGTYTIHAGTLAHAHGALRLPLAVPCVAVSGGGLNLHAHATERTAGAADDALFFTPFAFLCAPAAADAVLLGVCSLLLVVIFAALFVACCPLCCLLGRLAARRCH